MNLHTAARGNQIILEGPPATSLLHSPEDILDVIGACFEHEIRSVLLYAENLTERFFDLSSGEAGTILQKFRNYHIRLAVVLPQSGAPQSQSDRFREMIAEENQGDDFRVFEDRDAAEAWLVRN